MFAMDPRGNNRAASRTIRQVEANRRSFAARSKACFGA
jgi:hypothetical protein